MEFGWITGAVLLAAFLGGLSTAFLGFLGAPKEEGFDIRKFGISIIVSLGGAILVALTFQQNGPLTFNSILEAYLSGAGIEVIGNRGIDVVKAKLGFN
jgi:hypothetical protein